MSLDPRYQDALDYLYSFIDYSRERSDRYSPEAFELGRMHRLLEQLGKPHQRYPSIHIAGTKGKGSVAALVAAALQAGGYRTGLYTSPHLLRFTERIQVDGREIPELEVARLVDQLRGPVEQIPGLTTYELITALGFLYFAEAEIDVAVVEVGLGGRLDATNVIAPAVTVITSISFDHMHLLGNSLAEIAREKAGIVKPGIPLISAPQPIEAAQAIEWIAAEQGAPLIRVGHDWRSLREQYDLEGQHIRIWPAASSAEQSEPVHLFIPLHGRHQVVNASVAFAALEAAAAAGIPLDRQAIQDGFARTRWPGRFQVLQLKPALVADAAHNAESAARLRTAVDDYFPGAPSSLIFGASDDKDISGMLDELLPRMQRVILTQAVHPRAADPEALAAMVQARGVKPEIQVPVAAALDAALMTAGPDETIIAAGSLFVVGEVLAAWEAARVGEARSALGDPGP